MFLWCSSLLQMSLTDKLFRLLFIFTLRQTFNCISSSSICYYTITQVIELGPSWPSCSTLHWESETLHGKMILSFKQYPFLNVRTNLNKTSNECSFDGPLSKLFKDFNYIDYMYNFVCCGIAKRVGDAYTIILFSSKFACLIPW